MPSVNMAASEKRRPATAVAGSDQSWPAVPANDVPDGEAEFLLQAGVTDMVREALLKVLEARPEKPIDFLAGYFEKLMQSSPEAAAAAETLTAGGDVGDLQQKQRLRLGRALWYLGLAHHSHRAAFNNNVHLAYDSLNPCGKCKRPGVDGKSYSELLRMLCEERGSSDEAVLPLLQKVSCRDHEMVPFDIFRYGILTCLVLLEFLSKADSLYDTLDGGSGAADERICTAVLGALEEALRVGGIFPPLRYLEAGSKLRPDCLALAMDRALAEKAASTSVKKDEFLKRALATFVAKVKPIN